MLTNKNNKRIKRECFSDKHILLIFKNQIVVNICYKF